MCSKFLTQESFHLHTYLRFIPHLSSLRWCRQHAHTQSCPFHVSLLDGVLGRQAKAKRNHIFAHRFGGVCRQSAAQARTLFSHLLDPRETQTILFTLYSHHHFNSLVVFGLLARKVYFFSLFLSLSELLLHSVSLKRSTHLSLMTVKYLWHWIYSRIVLHIFLCSIIQSDKLNLTLSESWWQSLSCWTMCGPVVPMCFIFTFLNEMLCCFCCMPLWFSFPSGEITFRLLNQWTVWCKWD